jgi:hypothetical protein
MNAASMREVGSARTLANYYITAGGCGAWPRHQSKERAASMREIFGRLTQFSDRIAMQYLKRVKSLYILSDSDEHLLYLLTHLS